MQYKNVETHWVKTNYQMKNNKSQITVRKRCNIIISFELIYHYAEDPVWS